MIIKTVLLAAAGAALLLGPAGEPGRVVDAAPGLHGTVVAGDAVRAAGVTVAVTRTYRYGDNRVVLRMAVANTGTRAVTVHPAALRAVDAMGVEYRAVPGPGAWQPRIPAGRTVRGTVAFDRPFHPRVAAVHVVLHGVRTAGGPSRLVIIPHASVPLGPGGDVD